MGQSNYLCFNYDMNIMSHICNLLMYEVTAIKKLLSPVDSKMWSLDLFKLVKTLS